MLKKLASSLAYLLIFNSNEQITIMGEKMKVNILLAINENYINQIKVLLYSILESNKEENFEIFIAHRNLIKSNKENIINSINNERCKISFIKIEDKEIKELPVYQKRYPLEIYFRIFAVQYLPKNIDRILYLDADTLVINSLKRLYNMDFEGNYFIATTHIGKILKKVNDVRLDMEKENKYINSGVMLMNLDALRNIDIQKEVEQFLKKNSLKLILPDQDIISSIFGGHIKLVDSLLYNFGEREWNKYNAKNINNKIGLKWIRKNTVIIHYYSKNKPWNEKYIGRLDIFYKKIIKRMQNDGIKKEGIKNGKQTI